MSTDLSILTAQIPAFLQQNSAVSDYVKQFNDAALGGIKAGGFPRLSIKGSKFRIYDGEQETLITVDQGGVAVPAMYLDLVVVGANPGISKTYYAGSYVEGDDREPDCRSGNGISPDADLKNPQASTCATCPQNVWGSKVNPTTGKEVKACSDQKQLVVVPANDLTYKAIGLLCTPAAIKEWGNYVRSLSERNIPVVAVVTRVMFDANAAFPKLVFSFARFLTEQEFAIIQPRLDSEEVKNIASRRGGVIAEAPKAISAPQPAPQISQASAQHVEVPAFTAQAQTDEPAKRKRRTKEEIAADEAETAKAEMEARIRAEVEARMRAEMEATPAPNPAPAAAPEQNAKPDPVAGQIATDLDALLSNALALNISGS